MSHSAIDSKSLDVDLARKPSGCLTVCRTGRSGAVRLKSTSAMATVFVVTAGSGDTYRIERVYLDRDAAHGFAQDYNGIAPVETGAGGGMAGRRPARRLRRPLLACGVVGARPGRQAAGRCGTPTRVNGL